MELILLDLLKISKKKKKFKVKQKCFSNLPKRLDAKNNARKMGPLVLIGRGSSLAVCNLYCVRKERQSELPLFLLFYKPLPPLSYINQSYF